MAKRMISRIQPQTLKKLLEIIDEASIELKILQSIYKEQDDETAQTTAKRMSTYQANLAVCNQIVNKDVESSLKMSQERMNDYNIKQQQKAEKEEKKSTAINIEIVKDAD